METEMNILLFHISGHFITTTEFVTRKHILCDTYTKCVTHTHRMCDTFMAACLHACVSCIPDIVPVN